MIIGVPKEIKDHETRVGLVPSGVTALREAGHDVLVETQAGEGSSITDREYMQAGAHIVENAAEVWSKADLVVKVKEPQPAEYPYFRPGLILFTYLHLAPLPELTDRLLDCEGQRRRLRDHPRDRRLAAAADADERSGGAHGGAGGRAIPGEAERRPRHPAGRRAGRGAGERRDPGRRHRGHQCGQDGGRAWARTSTIIDRSLNRLRELDDIFNGQMVTLASNAWTIGENLKTADLVVGAVLIPGASAPKLVRREMIATMKRGAVVVDVAIDQGGCFETSHATTHTEPIYFVDGVLHYCVSNMPAAVPHTSTFALTNATFPYLLELANYGSGDGLRAHAGAARGRQYL